MRVDVGRNVKKRIVKDIQSKIEPLIERYPFLSSVPVDEAGLEVLEINVLSNDIPYKILREALEDLFRVVSQCVRQNVDPDKYQANIFNNVMRYVKEDLRRLQTYAILDDVVRYLF